MTTTPQDPLKPAEEFGVVEAHVSQDYHAIAEAYRESIGAGDSNDMFSLAYQWNDKPHRHVYDLCDKLREAADHIVELEAALQWMVDNDETNQGDDPMEERGGRTWNEINAYYIHGLNTALALLAKRK